jgi:electron transfer flavoprotein alpha subunit
MAVKVDLFRCTGCGHCVPVCPVGVLSVIDMKCRVAEGCISCGECVDICTFCALELEEEAEGKKDSP